MFLTCHITGHQLRTPIKAPTIFARVPLQYITSIFIFFIKNGDLKINKQRLITFNATDAVFKTFGESRFEWKRGLSTFSGNFSSTMILSPTPSFLSNSVNTSSLGTRTKEAILVLSIP